MTVAERFPGTGARCLISWFRRIALIERSRGHTRHRKSAEKDEPKHAIAPDHGARSVLDVDDAWGCDLRWHHALQWTLLGEEKASPPSTIITTF
jgi:hypothetical protein